MILVPLSAPLPMSSARTEGRNPLTDSATGGQIQIPVFIPERLRRLRYHGPERSFFPFRLLGIWGCWACGALYLVLVLLLV